MIKFMMTTDAGRKVLGIVISEGNVELLKKDNPIHFSAEEMGLIDIHVNEITIFYTKTEEEFKKMMVEKGYITKETIVHDVDKKMRPQ